MVGLDGNFGFDSVCAIPLRDASIEKTKKSNHHKHVGNYLKRVLSSFTK